MALETTAVKVATDTVTSTLKLVESGVREVWSTLDAAAEKQAPSRYLSQMAIHSIQGAPQMAAQAAQGVSG